MKNFLKSTEMKLILALALVKLFIHLLTSTNYELHRDAYLYLALKDHLDFGFVSVPPLIAVIARISDILFGGSTFAVRLTPALIGALSIVVIGLMVRELGGNRWSIFIACSAFILSPAFLRSNALFQPVSFDQFFWLLSGYFIIKMLRSQEPKYWLHLGVTWGVAFLNKYAIAFFVVSFLTALLLTQQRKLFISRQFVIACVAGLLIILPNLIWQAMHNWPVVNHMAELQRTQLVNVTIADFISAQILMNLPALAVWVWGLLFLLFNKNLRVLGYTFLFVIILLLLLHGKPYYTLGIYPIMFAAGGYAIGMALAERLRFVKPAIIAFMVLFSLLVLPYSLPILSLDKMLVFAEESKKYGLEGALRWEDGEIHHLPQDYADMTGWQELAEVVTLAYMSLDDAERASCVIYAENYGEAGAIKYYGKKSGLPEPVSFDESFVFWAPDSLNISTLIYVNDDIEEISYFFADVKPVGRIKNQYARESGLPVFLCKNPRNGIAEFYKEKVRSLKAKYGVVAAKTGL